MRVIRGDAATISQAIYGHGSSNRSFFQDSYERIRDKVKDEASSTFKNITALYKSYNDSDIVRRAKNILRRSGGGVRDEEAIIRYSNPRRANRVMREYVMAMPETRDLYKRGIIDGYSDTDYSHDDHVAQDRYNLATDGLYDEDGTNINYISLDVLDIEEDRLELEEQFEIIHTWSMVSKSINDNMDPTDA